MPSSSPSNLPTDFPERKTDPMTGLGTALPEAASGSSSGPVTGAPTSTADLESPIVRAGSTTVPSGSVTGAPTSTPGRTSLGDVNPDAPTAIASPVNRAPVSGDRSTAKATDGAGPAAAPRPGEGPRGKTRIGLYEVMEELGRGGMGAVYRAWHPLRRKYVALKVIKPDVATGDKLARLKELFLREGGILMSIAHENVVGCYDANEADHEGKPVLYMALELLEGESLQERLGRGPLTLKEAGEVTRSLARALRALHENKQRILHRDLKPANAFLCRDGGVKLLDFGLAGVADWKLTQVSMFAAGSRPYMPPEQFDGLRFCTERSDLYSLGCALFQMVTGKTPFSADTDHGFMKAHKEKSPPLLAEMLPSLAEGKDPLLEPIQNIATKLLAKRPDERYASAAEVVAALDTALGGGSILPPKVTRPEAVRLRNRILTAVATVVLAACFSLGAVAYVQSGSAGKLKEARRDLESGKLERAHDLVVEVLKNDPHNEAAKQLEAEIGEAKRRALEADAEARRAREFALGITSAEAALGTAVSAAHERGAPLERAPVEAAIRDAEKVLRLDHATEVGTVEGLMARLDAAARLAGARVDLRAARASLERGARPEARGLLEALARDPKLPAEVAAERQAIADDLAQADRIAADWEAAQAQSLASHHTEAERIAAAVRDAIRVGDPALEARLEARSRVRAQDAVDLIARSQKGSAIERLGMAVASQPLDEVRRALGPAEANGAAASDPGLVNRARRRLFDDAMGRALGAIAPTGTAAVARDAALEALRALSLDEAAAFRTLARAFGEDVARRGAPAARDALREALRAREHASAAGAWLILESALARLDEEPARERLFERIEGLTLGSDEPAFRRDNPRHTVNLAPFYVDLLETTVEQYMRAVEAGRAPPSVCWEGGRPSEDWAGRPVAGLLIEDAQAFLAAEPEVPLRPGAVAPTRRRLPRADEWEAAAAFGPEVGLRPAPPPPRRFPWGTEWVQGVVHAAATDLDRRGAGLPPPPSGSRDFDRTPWGGRDFASGVSEWTTDVDAAGQPRLTFMGGSFCDGFDGEKELQSPFCCVWRRHPQLRGARLALRNAIDTKGFRCARDAPVPDLAEFAR